ncbi:MAG: restriction endonuclease subunit S [Bacteroidales bacterium]|nr:restriction endonuclease subunit S [Bacteroidales bacterium]
MSKIQEMIERMCPKGVKYKKIKDVFTRIKGTPITATLMKEIASEEGDVRIFAGGKTVIDTKRERIPNANITTVPSLIVQSRGVIDFVFYDKPFTFKNEMWGYTHQEPICVKFLGYVLKNNVEYFRRKASETGSLPQISLPVTEDYEIPVPPLEVQREIVKVLDNLSELGVVLNAELAARKKQFLWVQQQCFANKTFMFNRRIEDCCVLAKGATPIQKAIPGEYPLVVTTSTRRTSATYQFTEPTVCIPLVSSRGHGVASLNSVYYQEGEFALGNILCGVTPKNHKELNAKYLYYYINYKKDSLIVPLMRGGANVSLTVDTLKKVGVSYPSIEEQSQVVSMLEPFDAFFDEVIGLPAEINARQQQYEYYRDQLLTFKRAN